MTGNDYVFTLNDQDNPNHSNNLENDNDTDSLADESSEREHVFQDSKRLKSLRPGLALLFALTDGSDAEAREEAEAIIESYKPGPWKGQVWRKQDGHERVWTGPVYQDLVWTGRDWEPLHEIQAADVPLIAAKPSTVPVALTEAYVVRDGYAPATIISPKELNDAYERFMADPDSEHDNLWVTIAAFVRNPQRLAQCRKIIVANPETVTEIDDIFMDFIVDLRQRMPTQYKHEGKLDRWINVIWSKYFFRGVKQEVIEYLSKHRFVNNIDPNSEEFRFEDHCVNTEKIVSDDYRLAELDSLTSPLRALSPGEWHMLRCALQGETRKEAAKRLNITPRHALRLLNAAVANAKRILGTDAPQPAVIESISAAADPTYGRPKRPENRLAEIVESHEKALTVPQLAVILQVSKRELYRLVQDNRLPALKIGTLIRLDPGATAEWIRGHMTMAA